MTGRQTMTAMVAVAALACLWAGGCGQSAPEGTPAEWLEDAARLEQQGAYYQENRENAPMGALEYYRQYLAFAPADAPRRAEVEEKVAWLDALRLVTDDHFQGKADYPAAIVALSAFMEKYPTSDNVAMALFYRGLAREYDLDVPNMSGAIADYEEFLKRYADHSLVPEVNIRIAHCYAFDLDHPDYARAIAVYDRVIERFGPTDEAVAAAPMIVRLAVERSLYNKARILEARMTQGVSPEEARKAYEAAAVCYERLTHDVFFSPLRFQRFQFIHYRLGCLLADKLGRKDEGTVVLINMAMRWKDSPWFGKAVAKLEGISGRPLQPGPDGTQADTLANLQKLAGEVRTGGNRE